MPQCTFVVWLLTTESNQKKLLEGPDETELIWQRHERESLRKQ